MAKEKAEACMTRDGAILEKMLRIKLLVESVGESYSIGEALPPTVSAALSEYRDACEALDVAQATLKEMS